MVVNTIEKHWAFLAGFLGDTISFLVFLAPIPTFYSIYKKKTTGSYHSVAYSVALFSAMMWLAYALLVDDLWLIFINSFGCAVEAVYLALFLFYAPRKARNSTVALLLLFNLGLFGSLLLLTLLLAKEKRQRAVVLGWAGSTFALCVFVAPLSVIRMVIKTKSVEYMPFLLSFFLTLNAVAWLSYGLLIKDHFVAVPNVLGLLFGLAQMLLYMVYRNSKPAIMAPQKGGDQVEVEHKATAAEPEIEIVTVIVVDQKTATCDSLVLPSVTDDN